jgi:large subunit ribosomal protein L4e
VSVQDSSDQLVLPAVFLAPIRPDVVNFVHTSMNKNNRQAYGIDEKIGMQHSAESWGTGRAVARIPRISGGGTSSAGQATFGNMCRGGRMFSPNKIWRKWHQKINTNQKRYAVVSALAASALPALVMARGHQISNVPEVPLVVSASAESLQKTKQAIALLQSVGAYDDVLKAKDSKKLRRGVGKSRNRRHVARKGPLVVYANDNGITQAFRNLPGVELADVTRLNLLQLAPGGHLGRFIVWTAPAFEALNGIYGSTKRASTQKKGYTLPQNIISNSDITRIINSDEIQSKVRPAQKNERQHGRQKKNPLRNLGALIKINPYAVAHKRSELLAQERRAAGRSQALAAARKAHKATQKTNYARIAASGRVKVEAVPELEDPEEDDVEEQDEEQDEEDDEEEDEE